jgi:hypothetical protein
MDATSGDPAAGDHPRDDAASISRLLQVADEPVAAGQPWILVGPTPLVGAVIRHAADAAAYRYVEAWREFRERPDGTTADRLRLALDSANAATAMAIGLARAECDASAWDARRRRDQS